uniref:2,4-dienoyl-CoA reductase [(3E)-enoyl-CoA-producing] n=1 Tax=Attheya septentrionalis TaxID=420275 RepID=A0A7S2UKE0_9STRA|mmetsp:Transcript_28962/g.53008  ORF Transcript_28962/g.53008 Transcript_28962/m.53008 type:complete len:302 (+) Transcript_28962:132-1037(+)|eukprot:CAMPEP_0198284788 /NCGR_PEP_ID=MMETSP1449-20131203/4215_1 /TAXON_ID=420275 /ORGANISM="Attheya septentrionalis, Strain CCMP2084" /LENGTH=301 /DNA_ID=CAMNT_0043982003 /DNA_START=131 /DNA_END=1036 /DNA_ORIENTATION=+
MSEQKSPFRQDCLAGKFAIVTGGGSGIGYGIVKELLRHGCAGVLICGRRESFLQRAAASLANEASSPSAKCLYKTCDVRDPERCKSVVEYAVAQFGSLDILVNGAAGNFLAEAKALKPKGFRTVMEIDTLGTYNMCHFAQPHLAKTKNGSIVNISATLQYGATWFQSHASAAKSAVDSLTRSLALEWGSYGIRVNGIAPGPIADTPGTTKLAPMDAQAAEELMSESIPLKCMGTAMDIGMSVIYLCADGSGRFITGDVLVVDGGHWLYKPPMIPRELVSELSRKIESKSRAQAPPSTLSKL